jgi:manganese transport protein
MVSLPEANATVAVPGKGATFLRRLLAFTGPGYMVSVGYMDPGNWATDIAGGSRFGYALLSVILLSNLMAVLLQALAARLGIVTGRDLAQACRDHYGRATNFALYIACQIAIIACDLAEVIGTAIALQLLFGIPLLAGVAITTLDVFLLLLLMRRGFRVLEAFIMVMLATIFGCFAIQIGMARPDIAELATGFLPTAQIVRNPEMLYIAIGILGATVMPHNLYLHSSIVQTRAYERTDEGKREAIRFATIDSTVALTLALFVNAAILIMAASVFHAQGRFDVAEIETAYELLSPMLGVAAASTLFALALLASGTNSTITATLAGQITTQGFLRLRIPAHWQRLATRAIAVVPVVIVTAMFGESGTATLLVASQVVLSMQLPFAIWPLVRFVSDRGKMGVHRPAGWMIGLAIIIASLVTVLNVKLLIDFVIG